MGLRFSSKNPLIASSRGITSSTILLRNVAPIARLAAFYNDDKL
jgi:hypothetical protein